MSSPELPETQPNWKSSQIGLPNWSPISVSSASWMRIPSTTGTVAYDEVGYGEGGFGEDGFDSPSIVASDVPMPIWTTEDYK